MSKYKTILKVLAALLHANSTAMDRNYTHTALMKMFNETSLDEIHSILYRIEVKNPNCCCNGLIKDVSEVYGRFHGYLSLIVCVFGTVANLLNIVVLTRKDMACTPVNRILTGLAVADMFVMVEYIPFAYYYFIYLPHNMEYPYNWAVYLLFHTNFAQVLHTISICLTLTLAIWRFIAIKYPENSPTLCTENRCTVAISVSYILPMFLCSPSYFLTSIRMTQIDERGKTHNLYHVHLSDFAQSNQQYYLFCLWTYSVFIKWLPCLILTVISYWLVKALCQATKRKQILRGYNSCPTEMAEMRAHKTERRTERTTRMLVAVLLLFLITELPQGILALQSAIRGTKFFLQCYQLTGNFMDILALINGAINFILYCCMSRQFRATFGQLFKPKILSKWQPSSQTEIQSTYV